MPVARMEAISSRRCLGVRFEGSVRSCVRPSHSRSAEGSFPVLVTKTGSFRPVAVQLEPRPAPSRPIIHARPEHHPFTNSDVCPAFMKRLPSGCEANRVVNWIDVLGQRVRVLRPMHAGNEKVALALFGESLSRPSGPAYTIA
jgi:hypothetical protein